VARTGHRKGLGRQRAVSQWQKQAAGKAWAGKGLSVSGKNRKQERLGQAESYWSVARTGSRIGLGRLRAFGQWQEQAAGKAWAGKELSVSGKNRQQERLGQAESCL
jgi:hypothetical protein